MDLKDLIATCAEITTSKGFDVRQHGTQVALMVTEAAEALEHITPTGDLVTDNFISTIVSHSSRFESYRKYGPKTHCDSSTVVNEEGLLEELADKVIRVFSYVGGNGLSERFQEALLSKIARNAERPQLHGKAF